MKPADSTSFNYQYNSQWFLLFLAITVADKVWMLINYGFKYIDDDQAVIMMAAKDMLHGHFYQPCFYGQSYNPLIESFLAIPLLAINIPVTIALPVVAACLGLLPFILFAFLFKKKYPMASLFSLALPMSLPWFYSALVIMPRGFVTGMAFASVTSALLLSGPAKHWKIFVAGFLSVIALTANPNCGIFLAPVLFYAWLSHFKNRAFYIWLIAGILPALVFPVYISWFYFNHADYIVHGMHSVVPSLTMMWEGILHSDWYLKEISFIRAHAIIYTIALYIAFSVILFYKKKKIPAVAVLVALLVFLVSFSIPKVHDGGDRLCYPLCRMYLGLPFMFVIFSTWLEEALGNHPLYQRLRKIMSIILLCLTGAFMIHRYYTIETLYSKEIKESFTVIIKPVDDVKNVCRTIEKLADQYHAAPVIFEGLTKVYCYGAPALDYPFRALYPAQERRKWLMDEENKIPRNNFLLIPANTAFVNIAYSKNIPVNKIATDPVIFVVDAQNRPVKAVLKDLMIDVDVFF